jgi:hypothetical protein
MRLASRGFECAGPLRVGWPSRVRRFGLEGLFAEINDGFPARPQSVYLQ